MSSNSWEILLYGVGGQGLVSSGLLLARAAAVYEGKNVTHVPSYGVEARGGMSSVEVVISEGEITYPGVLEADILVALSQRAIDERALSVRVAGLIVFDPACVKHVPGVPAEVLKLPLTDIAIQAAGSRIALGIVAVGAVSALTGAVSLDSLERAIADSSSGSAGGRNRAALLAGHKAAAVSRRPGFRQSDEHRKG